MSEREAGVVRSDLLGDHLSFRNGNPSPERAEGAPYRVFGSNGEIGRVADVNTTGAAIVIGRVGSYCGSLHFSADDAWITDNAIVAQAIDGKSTLFWYYALHALRLNERSSGSGQPLLNQTILSKIPVGSIATDQRSEIGAVLGVLDGKIEANRKLAATADDLAVAEFTLAARDAPLSDVSFADVATIGGGGTPRSNVAEYWDGDVQWLTPTDVTGLIGPYISETSRTITETGLASISSPLYPVGSIAMTSRATIGAFAILDQPMAVNQGFIVVQPNDPSMRYWIFHEMRRRTSEFLDHANGATFMELSRGNFKRLRVHLPAPDVGAAFNAKARALHDVARRALRESATLAALRDTLIPKLMSGQLRVKEVAIEAQEGADGVPMPT